MSSEEDNKKSDEYWMGVRDALRMVDSFNKWSKRNPGRAKDLEDFIHDGLIAAAKRCESCLRDKLGLSFIEGEDEEEEITLEDTSEFEVESAEPVQEPSLKAPTDYVETDTVVSPHEISDESSISLDSVERIVNVSLDDFSIEGPPREFSTDFELVEPTPLFVDEEYEPEPEPEKFLTESPSDEPEIASEPEPEEDFSESTIVEPEPAQETESEELPDKPSFTWSEYEAAVTPSSEPEPLDTEVDFVASEDEEISTDEEEDEEEEILEEPPEPPKVWSPYDEPSIPEDEDIEEETESEVDEPESLDEEDGEPVIVEPPSPPPSPESEEDEEERKRRARRLFFGA